MDQLFVIGLVILIGFAGGYTAHWTGWIPRITGYLVVGLLFGPSGLGLLSSSMLETAALAVTACNNLFSSLLFTAILPSIYAASGATSAAMFGMPAYILFGLVALGLHPQRQQSQVV